MDPDVILKNKIAELVSRGDFGLASGKKRDGTYERIWFEEQLPTDEVAFEADVFLLRKVTAVAPRAGKPATPAPGPQPATEPTPTTEPQPGPAPGVPGLGPTASTRTLHLVGAVPPELWNRLGTKILPKLRSGSDLKLGLEFSVTVSADAATGIATELRQILQELGLGNVVKVE